MNYFCLKENLLQNNWQMCKSYNNQDSCENKIMMNKITEVVGISHNTQFGQADLNITRKSIK